MKVDRYVDVDGKHMRLGYTTGTCAALAAGAAARALLLGRFAATATVTTPGGLAVTAEIADPVLSEGSASCAVRKDAGDDPDVTDGITVHVSVSTSTQPGIHIIGGEGVGRVTRPGLDQPVGEAAINSGPRAMIAGELAAASGECGYDGGWIVTVSIPGGERIAARTFNPELGIKGGLSVIGTTGIVEPMSMRAVLATIRVEMNMLRAEGKTGILATPGNYGGAFVREHPLLSQWPRVKCANYIGEAIDIAAESGFARFILIGHVGKLVKVAGGVMDTHSRNADCRMDIMALHAALAGCGGDFLRRILECAAVDAALDLMTPELRSTVAASLVDRIEMYCNRRARGRIVCGAAIFTNAHSLFAVGARASRLLDESTGL